MKTFIEHDNEIVLDEAVKYHVDNKIPLTQSVFRCLLYTSDAADEP